MSNSLIDSISNLAYHCREQRDSAQWLDRLRFNGMGDYELVSECTERVMWWGFFPPLEDDWLEVPSFEVDSRGCRRFAAPSFEVGFPSSCKNGLPGKDVTIFSWARVWIALYERLGNSLLILVVCW